MSSTNNRPSFVLAPPSLSAPPSLAVGISLSAPLSLQAPASSLTSLSSGGSSAMGAASTLQNLQSSSFPSWPTRPQTTRLSRPSTQSSSSSASGASSSLGSSASASAANASASTSAAAAAAAASSRKRKAAAGEQDTDTSRSTVRDLLKTRKHIGKPTRATAEREEARKRGRSAANKDKSKDNTAAPATEARAAPIVQPTPTPSAQVYAPQLRLVDGKIVLNEESMTVSAASDLPDQNEYDVVYESTNHVTSSSYTNRAAPKKWTPEETELFFQALRKCGTDFTMIAKMFPTRSRKQIRYKFKREDKENPQRISNALNNPLPLEGDHYAMIAAAIEADGGTFDPVEETTTTTTEEQENRPAINETETSPVIRSITDSTASVSEEPIAETEDEDDGEVVPRTRAFAEEDLDEEDYND